MLLFSLACDDNEILNKKDTGVDLSTADVIAPKADTAISTDMDNRKCIQLSVSEFKFAFEDDVSVQIESKNLTPENATNYSPLSILFERHTFGPDIGTFDLSAPLDNNFGDCSHCVYMRGPDSKKVLYADRGTLIINKDPNHRVIDLEVKGLRLVESDVGIGRVTTEIENGVCVEVADFVVNNKFVPKGWLCGADKYADGEFCDCACGGNRKDPDCLGDPFCRPGKCDETKELPIRDCAANQYCGSKKLDNCDIVQQCTTPVCITECDWENKQGCQAGVCVFDYGNPSSCVSEDEISANVKFGERCTTQNVCNVVDGFATGYCNEIRLDNGQDVNVCRPLCKQDTECTEDGETCRILVTEGGLGFCGPMPPEDG